jgi:hypothetical protein
VEAEAMGDWHKVELQEDIDFLYQNLLKSLKSFL